MSAALLGLAFKAEMGTHVAKLILLKLVDAGEDDGSRIYPGIASIAHAAQAHERTVQKTLREFQKHGLLTLVRKGGGGPGDTNEYHLNIRMLERIRDVGWLKATGQEETAESEAKGGATPPLEHDDAMDGICADKGGIESEKGGPRDHPTPPLDPLVDPEREGARERDERFEDQLRRLRKAWHNAASEQLVLVRYEFYRLTDREREACIAAIPAFLETHRAAGWKKLPKLHEWIKEKAFVDVEIPKPKPDKPAGPSLEERTLKIFKRRAAWVLFERLRLGKTGQAKFLTKMLVQHGAAGCEPDEVPTEDQERSLTQIPAHGPEFKAWARHLLDRYGIVWPEPPAEVPFSWAPSEWPPDLAEQAKQSEVAL